MPRSPEVQIFVDGREVTAYEDDTVATVLLVTGTASFHLGVDQSPRFPFCNMGTCFECTVTIDARQLQRACLTPIRAGMQVQTGEGG
jgi:sarcosine oxidase subunit alpha